MATTAQTLLRRLALRVDSTTAGGQVLQTTSSAVTITGAANNGSGLIRITAANHGFVTGNQATILGVTGTTEANNTTANPYWTLTVITSSTFDLQGSTFANAYVSGGTATGALIGASSGSQLASQRLLDIYNEARYMLFQVLKERLANTSRLSIEVGAAVVNSSSFQFTLTGSISTGAKPTGYVDFVSLSNVSNVPIILLPATYKQEVLRGVNPYYTQSSSNMFIFEEGTNFVHYGTYVTSASTYLLTYFGITNFSLTDIVGYGGATLQNETFNDRYFSLLIEIASAIASEQSNGQIMALAASLLGKA